MIQHASQVHIACAHDLFSFCFKIILKVATHEGTGRRDRSPGTKSHRVNRPIFVKNPVAGTCLVPRVNRFVGLVPATN